MGEIYCVYILTNQRHTVLYIGVTSNLKARVYQHREKLLPGFSNRYNVYKLVYYEVGSDPTGAIAREKQLKAGSRQKKIGLINSMNPNSATYMTKFSLRVSLRAKRSNLVPRGALTDEIAASLRSSQ